MGLHRTEPIKFVKAATTVSVLIERGKPLSFILPISFYNLNQLFQTCKDKIFGVGAFYRKKSSQHAADGLQNGLNA